MHATNTIVYLRIVSKNTGFRSLKVHYVVDDTQTCWGQQNSRKKYIQDVSE